MLRRTVQSKQKSNVNDDVDVPEGTHLPISNDYKFLIIEGCLKSVAIKKIVSYKINMFSFV